MNDNLARDYDYYQVQPEMLPNEQTVVRKKKQLTKNQIIARKKARLKRKRKMEVRKRLSLIVITLFSIFGTLSIALYAFALQRG
ncbi:hypothetical protein [uncultured Clostridium sp.]|uniref:hypothetical protein n=1 Tax=uncultured Clostridium sp. TaxID=59620 RepID=UPI002609A1F6|nr:hypothetical protein [uncultured Clostridium sp.]